MPIGTLLIFSLFANDVRTASPIGMGEALIDVFRPREGDGACRESIGGTWHMSIAISTILSIGLFREQRPNGWSDRNGIGTHRCVSTSAR